MKLKCYGTAAAEAIPAPYCACPVCENARAKGGKELRTRHLSTIDQDIQLDMGPDFLFYTLHMGLDARKIRYLVVTHAHGDHLSPYELGLRKSPYALTGVETLQVIGNAASMETVKAVTEEYEEQSLKLVETTHYMPIALDARTTLTALPANHAPQIGGGNIYVIERDGKKLLYAHDTGPMFAEVYDWLAGKQLDAVSLDCTGVYNGAGEHHMGLPGCDEAVRRLRESGALKPDGICIINHFSHGGGASYEQLAAEAEKRGWIATYDGIEIEI